MKFNKLIRFGLVVALIFSSGVGVGRYKVFPFAEFKKVKDVSIDVIEKFTHKERQISNERLLSTSSMNPMTFIAYGDNPYVSENDVESAIGELLEAINIQNTSLVVHVGDMFNTGESCTNSMIDLQLEMMNKLNGPVLYTPGDNDWTDCRDETKGDTHRLERLSYIRETYFNNQQTLGKNSEFVENQSERGYPENVRLIKNNVAFITAHVVGSNNNFDPTSERNTKEAFERDAANIDWVTESFNRYENASAFVVAIHADMFQERIFKEVGESTVYPYETVVTDVFRPKRAFQNFSNALNQLSNKYERPVLLLFGDSHIFRTFQPSPKKYPFLSAIETYGHPNLIAIEVEVDVSQKTPFRVIEIISYE
jgi:hypothetical protein